MANEVEVYEAKAISGRQPALPVPLLAKQVLSQGGAASGPFNGSTQYVRIVTTADSRVEFGASPDGNGDTILIKAGIPQDFEVIAGNKVIAVAA